MAPTSDTKSNGRIVRDIVLSGTKEAAACRGRARREEEIPLPRISVRYDPDRRRYGSMRLGSCPARARQPHDSAIRKREREGGQEVAMNIHSHDPTADHRQAGAGEPRLSSRAACKQQGVVN
jgi:hypothetical protein